MQLEGSSCTWAQVEQLRGGGGEDLGPQTGVKAGELSRCHQLIADNKEVVFFSLSQGLLTQTV